MTAEEVRITLNHLRDEQELGRLTIDKYITQANKELESYAEQVAKERERGGMQKVIDYWVKEGTVCSRGEAEYGCVRCQTFYKWYDEFNQQPKDKI